MDSYQVTITIGVEADSPVEAARHVRDMLNNTGGEPPIAAVRGATGPEITVDLAEL